MDIRNIQYELRDRSLSEIFDFGALVVRENLRPFLAMLGLALLVFLPLNAWILFSNHASEGEPEWWSGLHLALLGLVLIEDSILNFALVLLNGNLLFHHSPPLREVLAGSRPLFWRYIWHQVALRTFYLILLPWALVTVWRSLIVHLFKGEVLLLEKLKGSQARERLAAMNAGQSDRSMLFQLMALLALGAFVLVGAYAWNSLIEIFPLADRFWWLEMDFSLRRPLTHVLIFAFSAYYSVVRFLYYIDTRSHREGWDVELALTRGVRETEEIV